MSFLHQAGSGNTALPGEHICTDNATGQKDAEGNQFCRNYGWTRESGPRMQGPLLKRLWCKGVFWGNMTGQACGETLHGISHALLGHALFPSTLVACHVKETSGAVGIRHASSRPCHRKKSKANYEDEMADATSTSVPPVHFHTYLSRLKDDAEFEELSIRANVRQDLSGSVTRRGVMHNEEQTSP